MKDIKSKLIFTFFFVIYSLLGIYYINHSPAQGDEAHYLLTTVSIAHDQDIDLTNNYQDINRIDHHTIIRNGKEYLYHGLGLFQVILVPFYQIGGRVGVTIFLSIISALLILNIYKYCASVTKNESLSFWITIAIGLSLPLSNYSFLVFVETTAALFILASIRIINSQKPNYLLLAIIIGIIPWLHLRFLSIAFILLIILVYKTCNTKIFKRTAYLIIPIISILGYFLFTKYLYGSFDPTMATKEGIFPLTTKGNILINMINILIDRSYGLFIFSPIFLFVIPGFILWFKKNKILVLQTIFIITIYLLPVLSYYDWNGGYSPPARYLTPIIPLLIPSIVLFLNQNKDKFIKIIFKIFLGWGILSFYINFLATPNFGFVYMDGGSQIIRWIYQVTHLNLYSYFASYYPSKIITYKHMLELTTILLGEIYLISQLNIKKIK